MKKFIALFLITAIFNATFYIQQINVDFYIKNDGQVHVKETVKLIIEGETDVAKYNAALDKNELSTWSELIGSGDIKVHVNRDVVDIKNLEVRPQPLYGHNPLSDTWKGEIIITYDASCYYSKEGKKIKGTGLFKESEISPRITQYSLRKNALSFRTSSGGDYILEKNQRVSFYLPDNAIVTDVNPLPRNTEISLPARVEQISWEDTILVDFTLVFKVEEGIADEIYSFFSQFEKNVVDLGRTPGGIAIVIMVGSIFLTYSYLQYRKNIKRMKKRKRR